MLLKILCSRPRVQEKRGRLGSLKTNAQASAMLATAVSANASPGPLWDVWRGPVRYSANH